MSNNLLAVSKRQLKTITRLSAQLKACLLFAPSLLMATTTQLVAGENLSLSSVLAPHDVKITEQSCLARKAELSEAEANLSALALEASKLKTFAPQDVNDEVKLFVERVEQPIVLANNLLFRSYLVDDVDTNDKARKQANQCQQVMLTAIDNYLAALANTHINDELAKLKETLAIDDEQTNQAFEVLASYHSLGSKLLNKDLLKYKVESKAAYDIFRKQAADKSPTPMVFSNTCKAQVLAEKPELEFADANTHELLLDGKDYAGLIKRLDDEACRLSLYQQYQGRHQHINRKPLINLLQAKALEADAQGDSSWVESRLHGTSFNNADEVLRFLKLLHQDNMHGKNQDTAWQYAAPWSPEYAPENVKKAGKKSASKVKKHLPKEQVISGLMNLLRVEFGLHAEQIEQQGLWHKSVRAYALYQLEKNSNGYESEVDSGKLLGFFYLDLHAREGKYTKNRHRAIQRGVVDNQGELTQYPSSALILNLPKKNWRQTHIKSLFHEMGHVLHNILAVQRYHQISGISITPDLIEMPAKVFEMMSFLPKMQQKYLGGVLVESTPAQIGTRYNVRLFKAAQGVAYYQQSANWQPSELDYEARAEQLEAINQSLFQEFIGVDYPQDASSQYSFSHLATYGPRYYSYMLSERLALILLNDIKNEVIDKNALIEFFAQGGAYNIDQQLSIMYQKPMTLMNKLDADLKKTLDE